MYGRLARGSLIGVTLPNRPPDGVTQMGRAPCTARRIDGADVNGVAARV
jgi:hypothetical protein